MQGFSTSYRSNPDGTNYWSSTFDDKIKVDIKTAAYGNTARGHDQVPAFTAGTRFRVHSSWSARGLRPSPGDSASPGAGDPAHHGYATCPP